MGHEDFLPDPDAIRQELLAELRHEHASKRFRWRIGRRGAFLVLTGTAFIMLGYGYGFSPVPNQTQEQLEMPLLLIDSLRFWGTLWIISGVVAVFNAWWPPGRDAVGFVSLEIFSAVWAVLNISGSLFLGAPRGWVVGVIFGVYAASVLIVSGMTDPTPLAKKARESVVESKRARGED